METRLERARDQSERGRDHDGRSLRGGLQSAARFFCDELLFFSGDWRQDEFSGYEKQVPEAVGYGRRLIDNERHMLALEGGIGAKQSDLITGEELDEAIVRGALDYLLTLSENSEFNQKLLIEQGDDNRYTESTSALKTRIVGNLALVSIVIKNNSDVPVGIENTDRTHGPVARVRVLNPPAVQSFLADPSDGMGRSPSRLGGAVCYKSTFAQGSETIPHVMQGRRTATQHRRREASRRTTGGSQRAGAAAPAWTESAREAARP